MKVLSVVLLSFTIILTNCNKKSQSINVHSDEPMETNSMTSAYASVNGLNMYYEVHGSGSGSPLILLHGGGSTIHTNFGVILPVLSRNRKVIAVELQSHGHTSNREAPETFEQDANDVVELLRQLKITQADILGFSNGGQTAMELAIRHPQIVRKLVIASAFYDRAAMPEGFWSLFEEPNFADMPQVYKDEFMKIRNDSSALMQMFNNDSYRMKNFKGWTDDEVKSINAPTLITLGDQDVPSPEHGVKMHRMIAGSRLTIFPGNHGNYLGEIMSSGTSTRMPEAFVSMVEEFLGN